MNAPALATLNALYGRDALASALEHLAGWDTVTLRLAGHVADVIEHPGDEPRRLRRPEARTWLPCVPAHVAGCEACKALAVEWAELRAYSERLTRERREREAQRAEHEALSPWLEPGNAID